MTLEHGVPRADLVFNNLQNHLLTCRDCNPPSAVGIKQARVMRLCDRCPESRASDFARVTGFIAQLSPQDRYQRVCGRVSSCLFTITEIIQNKQ